MMEMNNRGSFDSLAGLVVVSLVTAVILGLTMHATELTEPEESQQKTEQENYPSQVQMGISHKLNTCGFIHSELFSGVIDVSYPDRTGAAIGRWDPNTLSISLMQPGGLTLETVAHEVSHAVDTIMEAHPGVDKHYAHYIQGTLTACVYAILERDMAESQTQKFKFAN